MKIIQLEYLIALEKYGSFSSAAKALSLTQPTMSVAIRQLEEELGATLLKRHSTGIVFTPVGLATLEKAKQIMDITREIKLARQADPELSGTITVGGTPFYCDSILLPVLLRMVSEYPKVLMRVKVDDSESLLRQVDRGELNLAVVQQCDMDKAYMRSRFADDISYEELYTDLMFFASGPDNPLCKKPSVKLHELSSYNFISFRRSVNQYAAYVFKKNGINCRIFSIDGELMYRRLILNERGIAVIPREELWAPSDIYKNNFCVINVEDIQWSTPVGCIHKGKVFSRLERVVQDMIVQQCKDFGIRSEPSRGYNKSRPPDNSGGEITGG